MPYELAALGAAMSWSIGGLIAAEPARRLGGPRFTRIRMLIVAAVLILATTVARQWASIGNDDLLLLGISAVIGLTIGDAALFTAMARIGPRRTSIIFTANAPIAAVLGASFLDETYTASAIAGTVLIVGGVGLAVTWGTSGRQTHHWESWVGAPLVGVAWAVLGAVCQAVGAIILKPVFDDGANALAVATVRVIIATPLLWIFARQFDLLARPTTREPITAKVLGVLFASGMFGMVIGMTLLIYAIGNGNVGVATVLSATSPVLMLPLLWMTTGERPAGGSWFGAALAVVGTALLI